MCVGIKCGVILFSQDDFITFHRSRSWNANLYTNFIILAHRLLHFYKFFKIFIITISINIIHRFSKHEVWHFYPRGPRIKFWYITFFPGRPWDAKHIVALVIFIFQIRTKNCANFLYDLQIKKYDISSQGVLESNVDIQHFIFADFFIIFCIFFK